MTKSVFALVLLFITFNGHSQDEEYPYPSLSPKGIITQTVGNTIIEIEYERPSARERKVFGGLVPWDEVWRTGAGHCTKISFDNNVIVGGQKVEAGKYSLFTIPNENKWTVIINKDTALYGSYDYDYKKDLARFAVIPERTDRYYETLNFDIEIIPNNARIFLSWTDVQIRFDIETTTDEEIERRITDELLTRKNTESNIYAGAAEYLLYQGGDLESALELTDIAIELDSNNGWARSLKISVYEKLELYDDAIDELNLAIENIRSRDFEGETEKENELNQLQQELDRIKKLKKE